jgi:trehalose 6-phosphate phosphatase
MNLLFSESGTQRMNEIIRAGLLCSFDFDGTLAPIVDRPEKVELPYEVQQKLFALSCYAPIAVITGRAVKDIQKYMGFSPDFIIGNHGLEGLPDWQSNAEQYQSTCIKWRQQLHAVLENPALSAHGIWIEDKCYSLSIHYRPAREHGDIASRLRKLFSELDPAPRVIEGKNVFNLLPKNAADKGVALSKLMDTYDFHSAIYVGDDVTDEDVFRLHRPDILTVRIEHAADSSAEFFLRQRQDVRHLLDELIVRLRAQRKAQLSSPSWLSE